MVRVPVLDLWPLCLEHVQVDIINQDKGGDDTL